MRLTLLSARDLEAALPMGETIGVMKKAFADLASGRVAQPRRLTVPGEEDGVLLVKPAAQIGVGLGAKLVSVFPRNAASGRPLIHGLVALFDPATGEPTALLEGAFLTAWRTGAGSGAATDLLARKEARVAAVIGSGVQAETQARAIDAARSLEELRVYSRNSESVARCVERLAPHLRSRVVAAPSARRAVEDAEVICTATTATTPVIESSWLRDGCHVNAIGTFSPGDREVDGATVARARVFVDSLDSATTEAGDLLLAEGEGRTARDDWVELGEVAAGRHPGRVAGDEVTLFKSVGVAVQDVAAGALALTNARRLGLGSRIEL